MRTLRERCVRDAAGLRRSGCPCRRLRVRRLPGAGRAGRGFPLELHCYGRKKVTSSRRCLSDSPPTVLLGLMRQWFRTLVDFTLPQLGTASKTSTTLAVLMNSGGSARISSIFLWPRFRSFLRRARLERISFARLSASRRCSRVLTGVADVGSEGDINGYYMNLKARFARSICRPRTYQNPALRG